AEHASRGTPVGRRPPPQGRTRPDRLAQRSGPGSRGPRPAPRADAGGASEHPRAEGRGPLQQGYRRAAGDQRANGPARPGGVATADGDGVGESVMSVSTGRRTWEEASSPAAVRLAREYERAWRDSDHRPHRPD